MTSSHIKTVWPALVLLALSLGFLIYYKIKEYRAGRQTDQLIIICAGDSITAAAYPERLETLLFQKGLRAKVLNWGRPGQTSGQYLAFLASRLRGGRTKTTADYILLQLGTNDVRIDGDRTSRADFVLNMSRLIGSFGKFRDRAGRPARLYLATVPPITRIDYPFGQDSPGRVAEEINPAVRRLAEKYHLGLADNYGLFQERLDLLPDIHPTEAGYRLMAENWSQIIIDDLKTTRPGQAR